jgi:hypothetical protein
VVAVNYFGNEMGDDAPEYLSNPMGNTAVLMIERGTADFAGSVIVNTGAEDVIHTIYQYIYQDKHYEDTWYKVNGKPVVIAPENAPLARFFTVMRTQWPNEAPVRTLGLGWISNGPNGSTPPPRARLWR